MSQRLEIDVGDGKKLVAEAYLDSGADCICVGIEKNGEWVQDLACIRQQYLEDGNTVDERYEVFVFEDEYDGDYTDKFVIQEYIGVE